jgi:tetratricopeptide (TPR) repeat protein
MSKLLFYILKKNGIPIGLPPSTPLAPMHMYHCPTKRSEILSDDNVNRLMISCENEESNYNMVWDLCNTDQDKLEVSFKASRVFVASGRLDESIYWIQRLLSLLRNEPGTNDKELGTFLSVLGSKLSRKKEHEEAINVLGEAMLKIKNIPESEEKHLLVCENYRAFGRSFFFMKKDILAIYYNTMSFDQMVEEHDNDAIGVNGCLSANYYRIGQFEQSIKYTQDVINMDKDPNELFLINVGDAYMQLEDFPNAYKYHADAFKLLKSHPDLVHRQKFLPQSYGYVAKCQMKMKYYSLAIKNYTKAINMIVTNKSVLKRQYLKESSYCHVMLEQFQEAHDQSEKAYEEISIHFNNDKLGLACNVINIGLLNHRMKTQNNPFLSLFFKNWMSVTCPIKLMAMCLRELFPEDLALFKKLLTQYLDNKRRRNPQVVAQEIRPHFRRVCNSVMMSRHIHTSTLSLRRSLMNQ